MTRQWMKPIACWLLAGMTTAFVVGCYPGYEREEIEEEEGIEGVEEEGIEEED